MNTASKLKIYLDANAGTYGAMSDAAVADALNVKDISQARKEISGEELFSYTDETEYLALTDAAKKSQWLSLCAIGKVTASAVPLIKDIFPNGTTTWGNIVKTENVSIADQEGLPEITEGLVNQARAI